MLPYDIPSTSGIYRIICTVTGKFYIGSAVNLLQRRHHHFTELRCNIHGNPKLQNAWNKYGEQVFIFEVLELVLPMSLTAREQYWFNKLKPFGKRGFNIALIAGSTLGMKFPKLSKLMLGNTHALGKISSAEKRKKIGQAHLGRKHSPEQNERHSQIMLGKPSPMRGKTHSPEAIKKMRAASTEQQHDPEEHASQMKTLILTSPEGEVYVVRGTKRFCREHNLDLPSLLRVAKGRCSQYKGWIARFP